MLGKLFKKELNNTTFLQELLQDIPNEKWLEDSLKDEMIDINHKDRNGDTFLIICIKNSKKISAKWLIEHNIDLTIQNNNGKSALYLAIEKRNKEIIKEILDSKIIDLEQRDIEGRTLLQNIVMNGHNDMAKVLISHGANINNLDNKNRNLLYDALSYGDQGFIQYLLNLELLELNLLDSDGNSIMHHIEVIKDDELAKRLLIAGANPTLQNKKGDSFLLTTALRGETGEALIDIALEYGANVNSLTINNNTILMELITISSNLSSDKKDQRESLLRTSRKMLRYGGDINAIEKNNESGLFNAIRLSDYDLALFLLSGGIDPNILSDNKETVLNLIIYKGIKELDLIAVLIQYGANPNIRNKDGKSIYELLNMLVLHTNGTKLITDKDILNKIEPDGNYIQIVKLFLENRDKEESLNYLDSTGDPLFFKPLLYGHFPLFKLYIKNGLEINTPNKANHSIFYEYIVKIFEDNNEEDIVCENFQNNLSTLLSNKADKNYQDSLGWTILHKIVRTKCNEKLFDILTKIVLFDYTIQDFQGRTVVHNAVWAKKLSVIKKIHSFSPQSINIVDEYELLPITYAALLGNQNMVILFLSMNSNISGRKAITDKAIKKFSPMLKNLKKLKVGIKDKNLIKKFDTLIGQIAKDFKLI